MSEDEQLNDEALSWARLERDRQARAEERLLAVVFGLGLTFMVGVAAGLLLGQWL